MSQFEKLTLFYDGTCPLCQAEILFLSRRSQTDQLAFVDIHSALFDSEKVGVSCDQALAAMYGQFANGTLIQGAVSYTHLTLPTKRIV